jgi:hypothetical protein
VASAVQHFLILEYEGTRQLSCVVIENIVWNLTVINFLINQKYLFFFFDFFFDYFRIIDHHIVLNWIIVTGYWLTHNSLIHKVFSVFSMFDTILSALCLVSVCLSQLLLFRGVDRSCSFMAQSMAYDPRVWTKEGVFFLTGPGLWRRGLKSKFHTYSYKNLILLIFKKTMSLIMDRGGRIKIRRSQKWAG